MAPEQQAELCFPSGSSSSGDDLHASPSLLTRTQRERRSESRSCAGTEPQPHLETKPGRLGAPRGWTKEAQNVTPLSKGYCLPTSVSWGQRHSKRRKGRRQGQAAQTGGHPAAQVKVRPGKGDGSEKITERPSLNTYCRLEHKYFHKWAHHLGHPVPDDDSKGVSASGNSHGTTEQNFSYRALWSGSFRCRKAFPRHHQMALLFLQIKTVALLCPWNAIIDLGGKRS